MEYVVEFPLIANTEPIMSFVKKTYLFPVVMLAHMLQGLENLTMYDFVTTHNEIYALEHVDLYLSVWRINVDKDWRHPYLCIVLKN